MYQYADKGKAQPEKTKEHTLVANINSVQAETKMPVQTKSLFSFLRDPESGKEQKAEQRLPKPAHAQPNNTGIPTQMKERFENFSGFSFDDVKVHYNSSKPAQLQALAYTQGNQVHIAPGQEKHLGHELGHVVQQKQGIVKPTMNIGGVTVNDEPSLKAAADVMQFKYKERYSNRCNTSKECAQRMVALACPTVAGQNDMVILTNIQYALRLAGGPVVALGENPNFSTIKDNEDLVIVEHGSPGSIGKKFGKTGKPFTALDIAAKLIATGKALPVGYAGRIIFLSCKAGVGTEGGGASLAGELQEILNSRRYNNVNVCGKTGDALTSEYVGEWTIDPDKEETSSVITAGPYAGMNGGYYTEVQYPLVKKYRFAKDEKGFEIKSASVIFDEFKGKCPTEERGRVLSGLGIASLDYREMTIEQKAALMSYITRNFYIELIEKSRKKGFLKEMACACSCGKLTPLPPFPGLF